MELGFNWDINSVTSKYLMMKTKTSIFLDLEGGYLDIDLLCIGLSQGCNRLTPYRELIVEKNVDRLEEG